MKQNVIDFLTPKQLNFCNEYLIDMNATRAALRAGYSASTALNGQLMNMPKIKLYLQEKTADAMQRAQVNHAMVLSELCKIAFGNMGNYFAADGNIKPTHELSDDDKAALWSVSVGDSGGDGSAVSITKFRMYNKLSALDKIAKHIGFYVPQAQEAQTIYSYVTTKEITADDSFDDPILAKEIQEQEEWEEKQQREEEVDIFELSVAGVEPGVVSVEESENEEPEGENRYERVEIGFDDLIVADNDVASVIDEVEDVQIQPVEMPDVQEVEKVKKPEVNPYHFSLPPIGQRLRQEQGNKYAWMRR